MGWDSFAMWDCEQDHMGWSGEVDGTVQVSSGVCECSVGKGVFWRESILRGYCLGSWSLGNGRFWSSGFREVCNSPSCNFEKFTQLVPRLLSLTFDGFGFDLWAEIILRLWNFDKLSFNVILFNEKLLPDPAFLCGF
nr:hypothetical protein [Tanacetum cinerariifolium]